MVEVIKMNELQREILDLIAQNGRLMAEIDDLREKSNELERVRLKLKIKKIRNDVHIKYLQEQLEG